MADAERQVLITGIGIVSSLGEGQQAHWDRLGKPPRGADATRFAPFIIHPLAPLELDKQIPKRGDQRQMEAWQRIGTYAAGLALDDAGAKGDAALLSHMDLIVAAAGGERDVAVDSAILAGLSGANDGGAFLNERLMSDLRPTLFLAQLSNLLAGNISIVHGVTGSSRTFMGEEAAGIDAVRIAFARIASGQSDIILVGGAHNAEREDQILLHEAGGHLLKGRYAPMWERAASGGGAALGSFGAFLVLESREHAAARGAHGHARLVAVTSDRSNRAAGITPQLTRLWDAIAPRLRPGHYAILSGASGAEPATSQERAFLEGLGAPLRATGSHIGHGFEPQFPMNIALAAVALEHGRLFPPAERGVEKAMEERLSQVVVTGIGHWRGEGMALVAAVE